MSIELDGSVVLDLSGFIAEVATRLDPSGEGCFGWDLQSLHDCLHGGFLGTPPYDVRVLNARPMVEAFGGAGAVAYFEGMLGLIEQGGRRGRALAYYRDWFELELRKAKAGELTLLAPLMEVFASAPASLVLYAKGGAILADSRDPGSLAEPSD